MGDLANDESKRVRIKARHARLALPLPTPHDQVKRDPSSPLAVLPVHRGTEGVVCVCVCVCVCVPDCVSGLIFLAALQKKNMSLHMVVPQAYTFRAQTVASSQRYNPSHRTAGSKNAHH